MNLRLNPLKGLPRLSHAKARKEIKSGDLYFQIDHNIGCWFIRKQAEWIDKYPLGFSHAGVFRWDSGFLMGIESVRPCAHQARFSALMNQHKGSTFVWCQLQGATEEQREKMALYALKLSGNIYDMEGIKGCLYHTVADEIYDVTGRRFKDLNLGSGKRRVFCSELCALTTLSAGFRLSPEKPHRTTPSNLFYDGVASGHIKPAAIITTKT